MKPGSLACAGVDDAAPVPAVAGGGPARGSVQPQHGRLGGVRRQPRPHLRARLPQAPQLHGSNSLSLSLLRELRQNWRNPRSPSSLDSATLTRFKHKLPKFTYYEDLVGPHQIALRIMFGPEASHSKYISRDTHQSPTQLEGLLFRAPSETPSIPPLVVVAEQSLPPSETDPTTFRNIEHSSSRGRTWSDFNLLQSVAEVGFGLLTLWAGCLYAFFQADQLGFSPVYPVLVLHSLPVRLPVQDGLKIYPPPLHVSQSYVRLDEKG